MEGHALALCRERDCHRDGSTHSRNFPGNNRCRHATELQQMVPGVGNLGAVVLAVDLTDGGGATVEEHIVRLKLVKSHGQPLSMRHLMARWHL